MRHSDDELGTLRRVLLIVFGLGMTASGVEHPPPVGWILGCVGLFVLLGASGLIELTMAIYYRLRRRAARHV